jgi:formylglycine-generating enzyme required for sulfatase activity/cephalosporin-C deacetylase-like acetyl esterase
VTTEPPGAEVFAKPYDRPQEKWKFLGRSPLNQIRLPRGFFRWQVTKKGFTPVEGFRDPVQGQIQFILHPAGSLPAGMVHVSGNAYRENQSGADDLYALDLDDYLVDRCEVTNKQFKQFVDQGGYRERRYWKHFHDQQTAHFLIYASTVGLLESPQPQGAWLTAGALFSGRTANMVLSWDEAIKQFQDRTGKPGPSAWPSGTYPKGEDDYPVCGVSWYEAAAYTEFAGKSLPTVAHWLRASGLQHAGDITPLSNFGSPGPALVGTHNGLGPFGTLDMAGNVREWCCNPGEGDGRYIMGGAWNEPAYLFLNRVTARSLDRSASNGFRCVRYLSDIPPAAVREIFAKPRDYENEKPVSDDMFQLIKSQYSYQRSPLNAHIENREESADSIHETISFDAAYKNTRNARMIAHLYLPHGRPPFQTVVFFPGGDYFLENRIFPRQNPPEEIANIVRSGRAALWPVYTGTCERWEQGPGDSDWFAERSFEIRCYQDLARSVDYLEERSDIDRAKLAYFGVSSGAGYGIVSLALDNRFKVAVLAYGGLWKEKIPLPEIDLINFVPRVRVPVLMINSQHDPIFPLKTSQLPMFNLLGTPQKDKHHRTYNVPGHGVYRGTYEKEMFSWLDQYLEKVR